MGFCYFKVKVKSDTVLKSIPSQKAFSVDDAVKVNRFRAEEKVTFVSFINIRILLLMMNVNPQGYRSLYAFTTKCCNYTIIVPTKL